MRISFAAFFLIWAEYQRWKVPYFHIQACDFLEEYAELRLLMMPRGHAKSTILGCYNAWRFHQNQQYRILHQGDQDKTARKCSRETKAILKKHPLCNGLGGLVRGDVDFWWMPESTDERNPSLQASGILSNVTSSRADEI